MNIKGKINVVRRALMRWLTGSGFSDTKIKAGKMPEIKRILLCRPNSRLGNQQLITPLVQELTDLFPGCKIDLFVRGGLSEIIFENYENVDRIIRLPKKPFRELGKYAKVWLSLRKQRYDLAINVTDNSSSGRLSTRFSRSKLRFYNHSDAGLQARYPDYRHIAKEPVYNLRHYVAPFVQKAAERKAIPLLNIGLRPEELENGKRILDSYVDSGKKTICIFTFATGAKCYSKTWWAEVYGKLKATYGETYNLLEVLPAENVSQINFEAPAYYSKDIREIASVMANSVLFVGADSGMMHLAAGSGIPTVGLFSVTDLSVYEPYGHGSRAIDTNVTDVDGILAVVEQILRG